MGPWLRQAGLRKLGCCSFYQKPNPSPVQVDFAENFIIWFCYLVLSPDFAICFYHLVLLYGKKQAFSGPG